MVVERILITGSDEQLNEATMRTGLTAIYHERRGQTVYGCVMGEDFERVLSALIETGCTVQKMRDTRGKEIFDVVHQGDSPPWTRNRS